MQAKKKLSDLFKRSDRGREDVRGMRSMWGYMFRDIIAKRGITASQHTEYMNQYVGGTLGMTGKAASTQKSNTTKQLATDALTWSAYLGVITMYKCVETTITVKHCWADGSETYHHRIFKHRRRGVIIVDKPIEE